MKKLSLLLFFAIFFSSCERDNGVVPEKVKEDIEADLKGKIFTAYSAQESSEEKGNIVVDPNKAFFTKMELVQNVIELTFSNNKMERFGYDINNANRGSTDLPDVYTLAMKSNYKNFYIYLNKDYSNAFITLTDGKSTYSINLKQ